jgi:hypothetical protein
VNRRESIPLALKDAGTGAHVLLLPDALVTVEGDNVSKVIEVFAYDSRLNSKRSLGKPAGRALYIEAIGTSSGRVFVADDFGILEFNLDGRAPIRVAGYPELPLTPDSPGYAHLGNDISKPNYSRMMQADEGGDRLFTHAARHGAHDHLVEVDLRRREIARVTPLPGFCGSPEINTKHSILVLPSMEPCPEVQDLRGNTLARFSSVVPSSVIPATFDECAIRSTDGVVAIAGRDRGIWLWDWRNDSARQVVDNGGHPEWSPDGATLYFMRSAAELWRMTSTGRVEPLVQASGHHRPDGWERKPRVSSDGRFVLALMTVVDPDGTHHSGIVFETTTGNVHQSPGFYRYSVCWG